MPRRGRGSFHPASAQKVLRELPASKGTLTRRSLLVAGVSAIVGGAARGRSKRDRPIVLGQVSLSFYAVTGAVVHEVLDPLTETGS